MFKNDKKPYNIWLHEVTLLGYEKGITISYQDNEAMEQYYEFNNSPEHTIELYAKYLRKLQEEAAHKITAEQLRRFILAVRAARVAQNTYFRHQSNLNLQKAKKAEEPVDEFIKMCEDKGVIPPLPKEPPASSVKTPELFT